MCRGLELLELIDRSRGGLRVAEIEQVVSLHRGSIYRISEHLVSARYLEKGREGRYRLGSKVLELAGLALKHLDIRDVAHPLLIELSEAADATVHLCRLVWTEVVYLDKVETHRSLPLYSRIGGRALAHCTGVGKALLAFLSPERLETALDRIRFKRFTASTITDRRALLAELSAIRERGYVLGSGRARRGDSLRSRPNLRPLRGAHSLREHDGRDPQGAGERAMVREEGDSSGPGHFQRTGTGGGI